MVLVAFKLSLQISGGDAYWKEKKTPWSKVHLIEGLLLIGFELIWALAVFFFLSFFFSEQHSMFLKQSQKMQKNKIDCMHKIG